MSGTSVDLHHRAVAGQLPQPDAKNLDRLRRPQRRDLARQSAIDRYGVYYDLPAELFILKRGGRGWRRPNYCRFGTAPEVIRVAVEEFQRSER